MMEKWMLTERIGDGSQEDASDILTIDIITAVERAAPTRWQPLAQRISKIIEATDNVVDWEHGAIFSKSVLVSTDEIDGQRRYRRKSTELENDG